MIDHTGTLYHFSENPSIPHFEPRYSDLVSDSVVWAVDPEHAYLYFSPRDCPRVTFYAGPETSEEDRQRFLGLGSAARVVAIEAAWLSRVYQTRLYRYEVASDGFELHDECAGYWLSRATVVPKRVDAIDDLLAALSESDTEVRIMPSLWPLYEAVVSSSLQFSIIRWRNAAPRPEGSTRRSA